jgi:hypothetical protein
MKGVGNGIKAGYIFSICKDCYKVQPKGLGRFESPSTPFFL